MSLCNPVFPREPGQLLICQCLFPTVADTLYQIPETGLLTALQTVPTLALCCSLITTVGAAYLLQTDISPLFSRRLDTHHHVPSGAECSSVRVVVFCYRQLWKL